MGYWLHACFVWLVARWWSLSGFDDLGQELALFFGFFLGCLGALGKWVLTQSECIFVGFHVFLCMGIGCGGEDVVFYGKGLWCRVWRGPVDLLCGVARLLGWVFPIVVLLSFRSLPSLYVGCIWLGV